MPAIKMCNLYAEESLLAARNDIRASDISLACTMQEVHDWTF